MAEKNNIAKPLLKEGVSWGIGKYIMSPKEPAGSPGRRPVSWKPLDVGLIDEVILKHRGRPGVVLGVLEEVQQLHESKFLPQETMEYAAVKLGISLSQLFSVVTFYAFFNLKPQGRHCIQVCRGTACHAQGSKNILEAFVALLGVREQASSAEEKVFITTEDNMFTIKTVACFGQCALAPVVVIDEVVYANLTVEKLKKVIDDIVGADNKINSAPLT